MAGFQHVQMPRDCLPRDVLAGGNIYGIPCNATQVLSFKPARRSQLAVTYPLVVATALGLALVLAAVALATRVLPGRGDGK